MVIGNMLCLNSSDTPSPHANLPTINGIMRACFTLLEAGVYCNFSFWRMMTTLFLKCVKSFAKTVDGSVGGGGMRMLKRLMWADDRSVESRMEE